MFSTNDKLLDQIFNLKFTSKQLVRAARKCEKEEKDEKLKIKKAIEKGNMDGAKIYAQNAIRKKNEALNYLRLGSRLDAVVSRLDQQAKMQASSGCRFGFLSCFAWLRLVDAAVAGWLGRPRRRRGSAVLVCCLHLLHLLAAWM
jgi:hypothetical protein